MFLANSLPILPGETSGKNNIAAYDECGILADQKRRNILNEYIDII